MNKSDCCNADIHMYSETLVGGSGSMCIKCQKPCTFHTEVPVGKVIKEMPTGVKTTGCTLDDVVSSLIPGQVDNQIHTFLFRSGQAVLALQSIAPSQEVAADNLAKMFENMVIEVRMRYPKTQVAPLPAKKKAKE